MLAEMERSQGGRPSETAAKLAGDSEYAEALSDNDIAERTARRWQEIAALDDAQFEGYNTAHS